MSASCFGHLGHYAEAAASYRRALQLRPSYADARANLGLALLALGDYAQGWTEYEWRTDLPRMARSFAQPRWQGEAFAGRTLLVHAEQGLGDTLQFIRFAPLVKQLGGTVLLECPGSLVRVLECCAGVDRIVASGDPLPHFDIRASVMSLPGILKITLDTLPASVPYLSANAAGVQAWQQELSSYPEFKVGIVWQGNPGTLHPEWRAWDQRRSIPLASFEPLARLPGVRIFSLQKGDGTEQLAERRGQETRAERWGIVELGDRLNDFTDTAAVMMNLDLIISADTSPVHLAGALGRPAWVALPHTGCWRWLVERPDSPWYPTLRLFRQPRPGAWAEVFAQMRDELAAMIG